MQATLRGRTPPGSLVSELQAWAEQRLGLRGGGSALQ